MTSDERLRFIQAVERLGYVVDAEELHDMMLVSIRGAHGYIVRVMASNRFDFEQAARDFYAWQQAGSRRSRTKKVEIAA